MISDRQVTNKPCHRYFQAYQTVNPFELNIQFPTDILYETYRFPSPFWLGPTARDCSKRYSSQTTDGYFGGWHFSSPDGRRLIKQKDSPSSVYSYDPLPDGKVTTIRVKLLSSSPNYYLSIGFASAKGRLVSWVGCQPQSFAWYLRSAQGLKTNCNTVPYGRPVFVGDVITVKLDLTDSAGEVTYYVNGQSMGIAFIGVRRLAPLYFGIHMNTPNDAMEILGATVSDS